MFNFCIIYLEIIYLKKFQLTEHRPSRSNCRKRKLENSLDINQPLITDYFQRIQRIVELAQNHMTIDNNAHMETHNEKPGPSFATVGGRQLKSTVLNELMDLFNKTGKRITFTSHFKTFCSYMYILAGPKAYKTLQMVLPLIALRTAQQHLHDTHTRIIEGELRIGALKEFLKRTKSPPVVWLSEDATRIISKLQIDPSTGNMIGILLDKDDDTGMPITFQKSLDSVQNLKDLLENSCLTMNATVLMARPLKNGSPPFCLMVTGCDNKFTASSVTKRKKYILDQLTAAGITVPGSSTDGDSRYTYSQRQHCGLYKDVDLSSVPVDWIHWFNAHYTNEFDHSCIQDTVHIEGKMRNNLFNASAGLKIGNVFYSRCDW